MDENVVKLDAKDRKLLFEMDFNARASVSELARKVGLSKQNVNYRLKSLQKKGVVEGFYPVIGIMRLGAYYCRFFLKFQNLTRQKEAEVIKEIVSNQKAKWILKIEGAYDLGIGAWMHSLTEMKDFSEELSEKYGQYIKEKNESISVATTHFKSRYLAERNAADTLVVREVQPVELDDENKLLLKELVKDSRKSLVELAKSTGLSAKQAAYRIKKLEKQQVILGYRPNINHNLLGLTHYKIIFSVMNVTKEEIRKFKSYLSQLPEVLYIVEQIGIGDIDIELMLPSSQSLFAFINRIKFDFPTLIKEYQLMVIEKTLKINYLPF